MKKVFLAAVLLLAGLLAAPQQGQAFGIGGIFGDPSGLSLSFQPIVIGVNLNFISGSYLQFHLDYWLLNRGLASSVKWYLGIGGRLQLFALGYGSGVGLGLRVPIGIQIFPLKRLELFAEYVPGIAIIPGVGYDHDWGVGFRFHI